MSNTESTPIATIRLFVTDPLTEGGEIILTRDQSHYVITVMRRTLGDAITLFNGRDGAWTAQITDPHRKATHLVLHQCTALQEVPPDLWLAFAPIKRGRIDWIAEKACELGIARLIPTLTDRTQGQRVPLDRLHAHLIEAAEQCGRTALPVLDDTVTLTQLLNRWPPERTLFFCDESGGMPFAQAAADLPPNAPSTLLIGPEGGFSPAEAAQLRAHPQARRLSLGPRILRADTAVVVAIALWQATLGEQRLLPEAPQTLMQQP